MSGTVNDLDLEEAMRKLSLKYDNLGSEAATNESSDSSEETVEKKSRLDPGGELDFQDTLLIEEILLSTKLKEDPAPIEKHNIPDASIQSPLPQKLITTNNILDHDSKVTDLALFYSLFKNTHISSLPTTFQSPADTKSPASEKTLFVLSPASYDHVFARSWVSNSYKASVVERPQRLMAASVGIGAALSLYSSTMTSFLNQFANQNLSPSALIVPEDPLRFQVISSTAHKNLLKSPHVIKVHGRKWAQDLYDLCNECSEKHKNKELEVPEDWPYNDIYLSPKTVNALEGVVGAVELAVDNLYKPLIDSTSLNEQPSGKEYFDKAFVAIRPPGHHSHQCDPSGFCLINNAHISIQYAAMHYGITHAVILDFDLHHGDGSQDICWKLAGFSDDDQQLSEKPFDDSDVFDSQSIKADSYVQPKLGYFSLHDINSFPTEPGYATASHIKDASVCLMMAHEMCIWNIHLQKFNTEEEFNRLYDTHYVQLFVKAKEFLDESKRNHFEKEKERLLEKLNNIKDDLTKQKLVVEEMQKLRLEQISPNIDAHHEKGSNRRRSGNNCKKKSHDDEMLAKIRQSVKDKLLSCKTPEEKERVILEQVNKYTQLKDKCKNLERVLLQADQTSNGSSLNQHDEDFIRPFRPMIVISAGFDASENETPTMQRHGVCVPTSFYQRFTKDTLKLARCYPWSTDYQDSKSNSQSFTHPARVLSLLEGGYSDGALSTGIFSHATGLLETERIQREIYLLNQRKALESSSLLNISTLMLPPSLTKPPGLNPKTLLTSYIFNSFVTSQFTQACKLRWSNRKLLPGNSTDLPDSFLEYCSALKQEGNHPVLEWLSVGLPLGRTLWPPHLLKATNNNGKVFPAVKPSYYNSPDQISSRRILRDRRKNHVDYHE